MDRVLAKQCCMASSYGYDRLVGVDAHPACVLATDETFIVKATSAALVLECPDRRIVVFPGTQSEWDVFENPKNTLQSVLDWIENLKFPLSSKNSLGLQGRQHSGFLGELERVSSDVLAELRRRRESIGEKPVVLTGHSQGGAIAAIAAAAFPLAGQPVAATYTFAAPRPGDRAFADSVRGEVWRMEYGDDIVPHLPFRPDLSLESMSSDLLDYSAIGQLVYGRPSNASLIVEDSFAITREMRRRRLLANRENWLEHHHLPHYMDLLEALP